MWNSRILNFSSYFRTSRNRSWRIVLEGRQQVGLNCNNCGDSRNSRWNADWSRGLDIVLVPTLMNDICREREENLISISDFKKMKIGGSVLTASGIHPYHNYLSILKTCSNQEHSYVILAKHRTRPRVFLHKLPSVDSRFGTWSSIGEPTKGGNG